MKIEQELQGLEVDLTLNIPAPEKWGTEIMRTDREWGEITRDYFQLHEYIAEEIEKGNVEVESVDDMSAGTENENVTLTISPE